MDNQHVFSPSLSCSLLTLAWRRSTETTEHGSTSPTEKTRTWLAQPATPPSTHIWALNRGLCTYLTLNLLFWKDACKRMQPCPAFVLGNQHYFCMQPPWWHGVAGLRADVLQQNQSAVAGIKGMETSPMAASLTSILRMFWLSLCGAFSSLALFGWSIMNSLCHTVQTVFCEYGCRSTWCAIRREVQRAVTLWILKICYLHNTAFPL